MAKGKFMLTARLTFDDEASLFRAADFIDSRFADASTVEFVWDHIIQSQGTASAVPREPRGSA